MNLKELSEKLQLSQTTVSRALNGYPEVSEATRLRVQQAAKEHNYQPNSRAKGLATGRSMVIGHVIPTSTKHEMVNPIFGDFVAGTSEVYGRHGYRSMFMHVEEGAEAKAYRSLKSEGAVDGVVLQGPQVNDPRIAVLNEIGLPFVVHGRSSEVDVPYSWLDVNNNSSFHRATELLLQLGHTRIALVNGLENMDFARRRRKGYEDALGAAGIHTTPDLMFSSEMTETYGHNTLCALMELDNPPTAILVSSMITAIGVRRAIHERGMKMGDDLSVITHDDDLSYLKNGEDLPLFTATRSSVRAAGMELAEMLIDQIKNPDQPPVQRLLEAEIVLGASTGPAKT